MKFIKRLLPKSLFGRALLILVLPTLLIQLSTANFFFNRHIDNITRHKGNALAGEIAFFLAELAHTSRERRDEMTQSFTRTTAIVVSFEKRQPLGASVNTSEYPDFQQSMMRLVKQPFTFRKLEDSGEIELAVALPGSTITFATTIKRLETSTTYVFILWMAGATTLFLFIGVLFLRNQIRPIVRLALAAESFGRGLEVPDFRPHGALEVRRAAKAFIIMRERIKRQVAARTQMLAGISHDLRTPLTRMKLSLAMLGDSTEIRELGGDVAQMESMINEYLDFMRGEGREEPQPTNLAKLVEDVVADYTRTGVAVTCKVCEACVMDLRPQDIRRLLHNIIDNAIRYGTLAEISLKMGTQQAELRIDDNGCGIPVERREEVFRPFTRLDPSRNLENASVGLGLSIAQDIVYAHGGSISLGDSPLGGLRVLVRLPF